MNPKVALLLATAGLAAAAMPSGQTAVGTPAAVAQAQASANQTPDRAPPQRTAAADAAMLRWLNSRRQTRRTGYPAPGWSVAEDRRRAKKRRNQLRNRRAHRGGGR